MEELGDRRWDIFISLTHCLSLISSFFPSLSDLNHLSISSDPLIRSLRLAFCPSPSHSLSSLLLFKIKYTFIALQCLIMVPQYSCLPVWSNNNSLISFYHSLSSRPQSRSLSFSLPAFSSASLYCPFHHPQSIPKAFECECLSLSLQPHVCHLCASVCTGWTHILEILCSPL